MAMLDVLILGNEQSEATTDVADSTDIYPSNASTGARADRTEGIAWLSPRLGSDEPLGRNDGGLDTHGVQRKSIELRKRPAFCFIF